MRAIYAAVVIFLIAGTFLFVGSFVYMDKEKRQVYHYKVSLKGCDIGSIRIDKFKTEEKFIYKSSSSMPFLQDAAETRERIVLSGNRTLESYLKERFYPKEIESVLIERKDSGISFVSRSGPGFLCLEDIKVGKNFFVFKENSPVTYLPLLENYDFNDGGSQIFEALTVLSPELPPIRIIVTLTSIKNEYLKIGNRKIKTENLIMKIRNYPQINIWVAKSDKAVIKIDLPGDGLTITRTFAPFEPKPKAYPYTEGSYISNNVTFKSGGVELSGTVTIPKVKGRYPALIMVWGDGPQDRGNQGFFDSIADYLSQNGVCVLRFDKRGVGSSAGSYLSYSEEDEISDIEAAAEYLANREYVDPEKIVAAGHAEGADLVLRTVTESSKIKSLILMSPDLFFGEKERLEKLIRSVLPISLLSGYSAILEQTFRETPEKTASAKGNWASILDKRRFLADSKWRAEAKPIREVIKGIKLPVLIIQGRKDEILYPECASVIDEALQEGGNDRRVLVYYALLGRFLGNMLSDTVHRAYYQADKEMMGGIIVWMNREETGSIQKKI